MLFELQNQNLRKELWNVFFKMVTLLYIFLLNNPNKYVSLNALIWNFDITYNLLCFAYEWKKLKICRPLARRRNNNAAQQKTRFFKNGHVIFHWIYTKCLAIDKTHFKKDSIFPAYIFLSPPLMYTTEEVTLNYNLGSRKITKIYLVKKNSI